MQRLKLFQLSASVVLLTWLAQCITTSGRQTGMIATVSPATRHQFGVRGLLIKNVLNGVTSWWILRVYGGTFFVFFQTMLKRLSVYLPFKHDLPVFTTLYGLVKMGQRLWKGSWTFGWSACHLNLTLFPPADARETQAAVRHGANDSDSSGLGRQNLTVEEEQTLTKVQLKDIMVYDRSRFRHNLAASVPEVRPSDSCASACDRRH